MFGANPTSLAACTTAECWGPLVIGLATFGIGLRFQLFLQRRKEEREDTTRVEPSLSSADLLGDEEDVTANPFAPTKYPKQQEAEEEGIEMSSYKKQNQMAYA